MSGGVTALVFGALLAVAALAFVLYPLFFDVSERSRPVERPDGMADDSAVLALREIEFDRATGKLSDTDYLELKKTYSARALRELRASTSQSARSEPVPAPAGAAVREEPLDPIEAQVRAFRLAHRSCPTCGVRPEADAVYCSTCGAYLDRVCPRCAAEIIETGATFCSRCGATLAESRSPALA